MGRGNVICVKFKAAQFLVFYGTENILTFILLTTLNIRVLNLLFYSGCPSEYCLI